MPGKLKLEKVNTARKHRSTQKQPKLVPKIKMDKDDSFWTREIVEN